MARSKSYFKQRLRYCSNYNLVSSLKLLCQLQTEMVNVAGEDEADDSDEPPVKKAAVKVELKI